MVEMLIVVAVILLLMGLSIPAYHTHQKKLQRNATQTLVRQFTAAALAYQTRTVALPDRSVRRLWDFNQDGILDGDPQQDPDFTTADRSAAASAGYPGTLGLLTWAPSQGQITAEGRLKDTWGRPLRIEFSRERYGADGIGVWSDGPNGINEFGGGDDLVGWEAQHAP